LFDYEKLAAVTVCGRTNRAKGSVVVSGKVARTTLTLSHDGREVGDEGGEFSNVARVLTKEMKGKTLGLPSANPREAFKVGNEFVEGGHHWLYCVGIIPS
jgi:hypothetical protein